MTKESNASEPKKGKKVTQNIESAKVAVGLENAPKSKGEVTGHISPGAWYLCHCDGTSNWVPYGWSYFICWRDGCFNAV